MVFGQHLPGTLHSWRGSSVWRGKHYFTVFNNRKVIFLGLFRFQKKNRRRDDWKPQRFTLILYVSNGTSAVT